MILMFHIQHDLLGADGKWHIEKFCRYFSRYISQERRYAGLSIFASPRCKGDPEFMYLDPKEQFSCTNNNVEELHLPNGLSRATVENELRDLVLFYVQVFMDEHVDIEPQRNVA
ncbi:MAG: hypothetical protein OEZ43_12750 [Gammaproteobacteria bacterium]|nr:hypothetical protein [Gammaproteobacteria bacterium]